MTEAERRAAIVRAVAEAIATELLEEARAGRIRYVPGLGRPPARTTG
jgi:hypothetical protein